MVAIVWTEKADNDYVVSPIRIDILAIHNSARPLDANDFSPS